MSQTQANLAMSYSSHNISASIDCLEGPIMVFGAGGFLGVNLMHCLLSHREDVIGVSQDPRNNWRFIASRLPQKRLRSCDVNESVLVEDLINEVRPRTVFNLSAYGAYSKQREYKKIYRTNFSSAIDLIEILKETAPFAVYVHTGSSSEYGLNPTAPDEHDELIPNSHYAVSKAAVYYAVKYYGKVERLPVVHLRLYSAYGPWEEPDRLIPVLVANARAGRYPTLVQPEISRDFIHTDDVNAALLSVAAGLRPEHYGEVYNVGSGIKTTIRDLALLAKDIAQIPTEPSFGAMPNRGWDVQDWYGNISRIRSDFGWMPWRTLREGLSLVLDWQRSVDYDNAYWNWMKTA
jgi:dolichol-phosphate mannosyltransferase